MEPAWMRKQLSNRKVGFRLAIVFTLLFLFLVSYTSYKYLFLRHGEFDTCVEEIAQARVPAVEELARLELEKQAHSLSQYRTALGHNSTHVRSGARQISASELMDMVNMGESPTPWIVHQSWKDGPLPGHFQKWSDSWKESLNDTWMYVLWRDEDNRKLVERYYADYLEVYDSLPREIYRADMVRNLYMHRFGGIYADLDLVPVGHLPDHLPFLKYRTPGQISMAYLGHMGEDSYEHSIPNAFMASSGLYHPFWLQPLEYVKMHWNDERYNKQPEELTGPVALRACVKEWEKGQQKRQDAGEFAEITVLSNEKIYPFSWYDSPQAHKCLCRTHSPHFNELQCKWAHPNAWTLTYWTHTWGF
ncbi:glycosyltransferase family 32 protein [Serendipita vermifera MAFF 305830]|uniref:Glycosyltransferase family 32 protein n=1 Tax=Serendipita vermifera MAFF 305830 TaxID=933852 RepID=A0A0C2XDP4_SERVB|nr:glycosyltransferase family 32 protein [Serendipita vermifera MAFF 305830]